jgi:hypothetical protein
MVGGTCNKYGINQVGTAETLQVCIHKVLLSNLSRAILYLD